MSIELGRGLKRAGEILNDNDSSNIAIRFGDDSQYDVMNTPPIRLPKTMHKPESMRREASIRRANEGAKRTTSQNMRSTSGLQEALAKNKAIDNDTLDSSYMIANVNTKNTRFMRAKVIPVAPSGQNNTPARPTEDTFMLPDVSNLGDLINPEQATPMSRFVPPKSRSRFTPSAAYRMPVRHEGPDRVPVISVPIPEDEKKIYAALQTLQERVANYEADSAEMKEHINALEKENIELRNALEREEQLRRPDSALGDDNETEQEKWRQERIKLRTDVKSLQQRFDRLHEKLGISEAAVKAQTTARDHLTTQLGVEYFRVREIEAENDELRRTCDELQHEVSVLKQELRKVHTSTSKNTAGQATAHSEANNLTKVLSKRSSTAPRPVSTSEPRREDNYSSKDYAINFDFDTEAREQIANIVKTQFERQQSLTHLTKNSNKDRSQSLKSNMFDLGSRPVRGSAIQPHNADVESDNEHTEFELTRTKNLTTADVETGSTTELTLPDPMRAKNLRQILEQQRRASHQRRHSSAPSQAQPEPTTDLTRQSSLRDVTAQTGHRSSVPAKAARTVRVQSPHLDDHVTIDDDGDVISATRTARRLSEPRAEGDTSAFIIPDITLHRKESDLLAMDANSGVKHNKASCTVCNASKMADTAVPGLVKVSLRSDLPEDATLRPSQHPVHALESVVQQLQDELVHLKLGLERLHNERQSLDPSIGASKHEILYQEYIVLLEKCRMKEKQIYDLYDALEGQCELESSARVTTKAPAKSSLSRKDTKTVAHPALNVASRYNAHSDDESLELPAWEGLSDDEDA